MKSKLKGWIERILVDSGVARLRRTGRRGETLILAYHNVVPDEDAARAPDSLHLPLSHFLRQLDFLEREASVVALESLNVDAAEGRGANRGDRPRVVLTFDDAYRGAVELAVPELLRRDLPATIFLCPGLLEADRFWWDAFDPQGVEEVVFQKLAGEHLEVGRFLSKEPARVRPRSEWRVPANPELLAPLLRPGRGQIRFGSHSWTHPNLAVLTEHRLRDQLHSTWSWLEQSAASPSPWLACPYGFTSPLVARVAAEVGYTGVLEIAGGWVPRVGWDRYRTPRLNVPAGLSDRGFELRISGLLHR